METWSTHMRKASELLAQAERLMHQGETSTNLIAAAAVHVSMADMIWGK